MGLRKSSDILQAQRMKEILAILVMIGISALAVFIIIKLTPIRDKREEKYRKALLKKIFDDDEI